MTHSRVFSSLAFSASPPEIKSVTEEALSRLDKALALLVQNSSGEVSFYDGVAKLDRLLAELTNSTNPVTFLKYVSQDEPTRTAADECENRISQKMLEVFGQEDLYRICKATNTTPLDPVEKRLHKEYLLAFERNGLGLSTKERAVFLEKKKRLVLIESEFAKNLVEWKVTGEFDEAEIKGAPADYLARLERKPNGHYVVTLAYPDYFPFMEHVESGKAREELENLFFNRGGEANKELLHEAIALRHECAQMLGYPDHACFIMSKQMAKSPEKVTHFLDDLAKKLRIKAEEEIKVLQHEKQAHLKSESLPSIVSSDWRFYENRLKQRKYQVDGQKIKEYFPIDKVLRGMFDIYQLLFGVRFEKEEGAPVWFDGALCYRVVRNSHTVSHFYMDLFPRQGKYGHAAAFTLISGYEREDKRYQAPVSAIVANFNPAAPGKPSLLDHSEVETLFHEFGHIMHQILTEARFPSFSGTSVHRDFVEAPSQMLESWVWESSALEKISAHYETGNPFPEAEVKKLLALKNLNCGIKYLRQVSFARMDLEFHRDFIGDTTDTYRRITEETMMIPVAKNTMPEASFGHLMGGYDAGYYGYLWSEVFAADMFTRFENEGLFNAATGNDYVSWILAPGGEKEPEDLIAGFLRRPPQTEAFFKSIGL